MKLFEKDIIRLFNDKREMLIGYCAKYWNKSFDMVFIESMVDEVLIFVLHSNIAKKGFNDNEHLGRFFIKSINKRMRIEWFKKKREENKMPICQDMLRRNFEIARGIIDSHRRA